MPSALLPADLPLDLLPGPPRPRGFPPLELHAEVTTADGLAQYRWDANARDPTNRPQAITCASSLMDGFAGGGAVLPRDIHRDYPDIGVFAELKLVGTDGDIAYEGYLSRAPRSNDNGHRISVEAVGWMMHARDYPITFLGLDMDMAQWVASTQARQATLQAAGFALKGAGTVLSDKTLSLTFEGSWDVGAAPVVESWYDTGASDLIGAIYYQLEHGANLDPGEPAWQIAINASTTRDTGAVDVWTGDLHPSGPDSDTLHVPGGRRFAQAILAFFGAPGGVEGTQFNVDFTTLQVIGNHGIELIGAGPYGILASDIIRRVFALGAPLIDTSTLTPTSHPIDQFAIRDLTAPYDIALVANQYERRLLQIWEDRKLFNPSMPDVADTATPDWVIRTDGPLPAKVSYDGPTVDGQRNGIRVQFQDIGDGTSKIIDPTTHPELAATDSRLAANQAGRRVWGKPIVLPNPNSETGAARIGRAVLDEYNRRRTPGRFVLPGYIRDHAGNWHQGWKVRAGQTVLVENDDSAPVRMIHEPSWSQDTRSLTMNADADADTIDAILDRVING